MSFAGFRGSAPSVLSWSASSVTAAVPNNLVAGRYELTVSWIDPATGARASTAAQPIWLQVSGPSLPLVLRSNAHVLDASTLQTLVPVTFTQLSQPQLNLTFNRPLISSALTTAPTYQVGDVLLAGISPATPYGLMRKVTAVQQQGSTLTLVTAPATLRDAIVQANLAAHATINSDSIHQALVAQGVLAGSDPITGCPNTFDLPVTSGVDIKGSMCGDLAVDGQVYVDWDDAGASATITGADTFHIQATATGNISTGTVTLYTLQLGAVAIGPLVLSAELDLSVQADGQVTGTVSFGSTQIASTAIGASCDVSVTSGLSCGYQDNFTNGFKSDTPSFGDNGNLTVKGTAELLARLDGVKLVDLSFVPSVTGSEDRWSDPWWKISGRLQLTFGYDIAYAMGINDDVGPVSLTDVTIPVSQAAGAAPGVVPTIALSTSTGGLVTTATSTCFANSVQQTPNNPKISEGCEPVALFVTAKDGVTGHALEFSPASRCAQGATTDSSGKCSSNYVAPFPGVGTGTGTILVFAQLPDATSNPVTVTVIAPAKITCVDVNGNPC